MSPNQLAGETSPYLLQHANNPVDWYPWGEEALTRAAELDRPILLSIGYAACHWCHVMERESFEDPQIAAFMNEHFVCVKVDREERPDIDAIYMDAVQTMTGHGGWPMTMFLTPDGRPFYGGTYFPPDDRHGLPSFKRLLEGIAEAWRERRSEVESQGTRLVEHITAMATPRASTEPLTSELVAAAVKDILSRYDPTHGGFGGPPKFPQAPVLEFLLENASGRGEASFTLERMALGGIYDQLGGGFHRYSVDGQWLVPHFEKMLYDNAHLARVYTRAWQAENRPLFRRIAIETCNYLLRDLRDPDGGLYSSEDADSEGVEGKFYVWNYEEFMQIAGDAAAHYGVTQDGNFEGTNILTAHADSEPPDLARANLLQARSRRVRPTRDEKILTSWNGLAISGLAEAGACFDIPEFIEAAEAAARFLLERSMSDGRLLHSYKDGKSAVLGLLEDYAYLSEGLLTLWEATFNPRWYEEALSLATQMVELFADPVGGGLFTTGHDHERLVVRQKETTESATPAPMATASLVLQKLAVISGRTELSTRAVECLRLAHDYMQRAPQAVPTFLRALGFWLSTPKEIVIVAARDPAKSDLFREAWRKLLPNRVLAGSPPGIESPMLEGRSLSNGLPTAYVCEHYSCRAPTTEPAEMAAQL